MRRILTFTSIVIPLLAATSAVAEDHLNFPYRHQMQSGLRGLSVSEIAELRAGTGMGLARAAELNGYPGPRNVLDAVESGQLQATTEQPRTSVKSSMR